MTASPITKAPETQECPRTRDVMDRISRLGYSAANEQVTTLCWELELAYDSLARELEHLKEEIPLLDAVLTQARVVLLSSIQSDGQPSQSSLAKLSDLCRAHYDWRTQRIAAALKPSNEVGT